MKTNQLCPAEARQGKNGDGGVLKRLGTRGNGEILKRGSKHLLGNEGGVKVNTVHFGYSY